MIEDLIMLCDELEKSPYRKSGSNRIGFVKIKLKEYIGKDEDRLLGLKAQLKIQKAKKEIGISELSTFFISVFTLCLTIISKTVDKEPVYFGYAIYGLLALLVVLLINNYESKKYKHRNNWIKYIEVVIENWVEE